MYPFKYTVVMIKSYTSMKMNDNYNHNYNES